MSESCGPSCRELRRRVFTAVGCYALLLSRLVSDFPLGHIAHAQCHCTQSKQLMPRQPETKHARSFWSECGTRGWGMDWPPRIPRRFFSLDSKTAGMTGQPPSAHKRHNNITKTFLGAASPPKPGGILVVSVYGKQLHWAIFNQAASQALRDILLKDVKARTEYLQENNQIVFTTDWRSAEEHTL